MAPGHDDDASLLCFDPLVAFHLHIREQLLPLVFPALLHGGNRGISWKRFGVCLSQKVDGYNHHLSSPFIPIKMALFGVYISYFQINPLSRTTTIRCYPRVNLLQPAGSHTQMTTSSPNKCPWTLATSSQWVFDCSSLTRSVSQLSVWQAAYFSTSHPPQGGAPYR